MRSSARAGAGGERQCLKQACRTEINHARDAVGVEYCPEAGDWRFVGT